MKNGGSDLHIKATSNIRVRIHGELYKLGSEILSPEDVDGMARAILTKEQYH